MAPFNVDQRKYYPICITMFALLSFFPGLGSRDLWAPVEPRYAEIVRVMFTNGEWILPTVNGDLYSDKPILYFWIALIAAKLTGGVSEWAVRLPAALGGVGFVLATYWLGRDLFNLRVGVISAVVVATSHRVMWEARWAHVDTLFGAFFLLAIYFGARALFAGRKSGPVLLAYVFMGLATLTKGLIGILLPGLLFVALLFVHRDWRVIRAAAPIMGIAVFILVAAPWLIAVHHASDGKWLTDFIYIHHWQRFVEGAGHRQPFYYYFTTLPADFLPWTTFLVPALFAYGDVRRLRNEPQLQFCLLWFLTVFLFFSLSDTKRDLYLLPLLPTLAFLVANYLDDLERGCIAASALYLWFSASVFGIVSASGIALPLAAWIARPEAVGPILPTSIVLAAGGSLATFMILRRRPIEAAVCVSAMMMLGIITASAWMFPYLERFKSDRNFALEISRIVPATAALYVYSDHMHDFNYYTQRAIIPVLNSAEEVAHLRVRAKKSYLLIKERDLRSLPPAYVDSLVARRTRGNTTWILMAFDNQAKEFPSISE